MLFFGRIEDTKKTFRNYLTFNIPEHFLCRWIVIGTYFRRFELKRKKSLRVSYLFKGQMNFIEEAIKHRNKKKILTEPLVAAYLHMKWQSLKVFFYGYWIFFILFLLVPLTLMTTIMVEMNDCAKK